MMNDPHPAAVNHEAPDAGTAEPARSMAPGESAQWPRRVVLATDGRSSAAAAFRVARAFEERSGAVVQVLAVYVPRTPVPFVPGLAAIDRCAPSDRGEVANLVQRVRAQMAQALAEPRHLPDWPIVVDVGAPGATIARVADEAAADLVVLGLGVCEPPDRRVGTRTAMSVARHATVPVYAATCGGEMPTRAVVPILAEGLHAPTLRATASCLPPGGEISLAYLGSANRNGADADATVSPRELVEQACGPSWKSRLDQLDIAGVDVEGRATSGTLGVVEKTRAELVAVPHYGDPGAVRAFLPNLADALLLGARCSVLVVPDPLNEAVVPTLGGDGAPIKNAETP